MELVPDAPIEPPEGDLAPDAPIQPPVAEPSFVDRLGAGLTNIGHTIAAGAGAVKTAVTHPVDTITDPSRRREFERGLDNMVTLGYGQRLAARIGNALGDAPATALGPETFNGTQAANTQAADREAAPGFREAGGIAGMFTPGAANAIGKVGGAAVKGATAGIKAASVPAATALGAAQGAAGYAATAPATAALAADAEGHRAAEAERALTDPTGYLIGTAIGGSTAAIGSAARTAPARVLARAKRDITTGEQNAPKRSVGKLDAVAGEDDEHLAAMFAREPKIYKAIATSAKSMPGRTLKKVQTRSAELNEQLDEMYDAMERGGRTVTPQHVDDAFTKRIGEALKRGDAMALKTLRDARETIRSEYQNVGAMSADTLRGLKSSARQGAFGGNALTEPTARAKANREVFRVFADAIESQASKTPGVDVGKLRALNRDISILVPVEVALKDRATMAAAHRFSLKHLLHAPMGAAAGGLLGLEAGHGGIEGLALGAGLALGTKVAAKAAGQTTRNVDFQLAQRGARLQSAEQLAAPAGAHVGLLRELTRPDELAREIVQSRAAP